MSSSPSISIPVVRKPVTGSITPPGSKSITNRALVCAALANGTSTLFDVLDSEDTQVMMQAWQKVGIAVEANDDCSRVVVRGQGGNVNPASREPLDLFVHNSGTSIRFLTAALAACGGNYRLDGIERMRQRPIGDLGNALRQLGADVQCHDEQFPPVCIQSEGLVGGLAQVESSISSQYLSGLLMAAPLADQAVQLNVGHLVSRPYVEMTCAVMRSFGVEVQQIESGFVIQPQSYSATDYRIEPDASAASYFWAAAAITGGRVKVNHLNRHSLQGDVGFVECLAAMGCEVTYEEDGITVAGRASRGVELDMNAISDTVQTLAAVALFAEGPTTVRGVAHNRHKETDRIEDLATELRRAGAQVQTFEDGLTIQPGPLKSTAFQTYNDHRMAMSLALVGLKQPGIDILNPACTQKTYPRYFEDLFRLTECS